MQSLSNPPLSAACGVLKAPLLLLLTQLYLRHFRRFIHPGVKVSVQGSLYECFCRHFGYEVTYLLDGATGCYTIAIMQRFPSQRDRECLSDATIC